MNKHDLGQLPKLPKLPHWDVSNVYPSLDSIELQRATKACAKQISALEKVLDQYAINKSSKTKQSPMALRKTLAEYLERMNALMTLYVTAVTYLRTFVTTDSFNATARRMTSELEPLGVRITNIETRFCEWAGGLGDALEAMLKQGKQDVVQEHTFYLREAAAHAKHLMSKAEESLAAELSLSGVNAWSKLQGTLVSQLAVEFEHDGQRDKISMPALINIQQHDPDLEVRRNAYELELATWDTVKEPLAAAMNGVKGTVNTLSRRRGYKSPLHAATLAKRFGIKGLANNKLFVCGTRIRFWPCFSTFPSRPALETNKLFFVKS